MSSHTRVKRRRLGEILIDEGLVKKEQVQEAQEIQRRTGETLGSILIDMGCISDTDITKIICVHYQLPFIRLENYEVDSKVVGLFPVEFLHRHRILPFDRLGGMILCAVTEIPGEEVLAEIPRLTRHNAALYVGSLTEIGIFLQRICPLPEELRKKRERQKSAAKPEPEKKDLSKIFNEDSSEALLQALDSTWDSIFESVENGSAKEED
jgi:type IV pilus assembly protein PilB